MSHRRSSLLGPGLAHEIVKEVLAFLRLSRFLFIRGANFGLETRGGEAASLKALVHALILDKLRQIVAELASASGSVPRRFDDNDYRLAAAALLVHLISIDGDASAKEQEKLRSLLASRFDLDDAAVGELIEAAKRVEGESVDLYRFTSLIMRSVDEQGRARIVEMMWELVYADDHISEFEESMVWRSADLLGVSSNERIALRNRVAGNRIVPKAAN
ncbi:TerB family tellurite resistance protein [Bradyrhizobium sp. LHD-71]|uniref:tellurite resistance TerB family protein n=1 Tax=Bradyrhizobium sp. LHD-71 TaxID=3072141 RepID=UPI0035BE6C18